MKVGKNMKVSMDYKLFVDGNLVDQSQSEPFTFIFGYSQVIPGLEKNMEGMEVNEKKTITVEPEEAYGEKRDDLVQTIPLAQFPENAVVEPGQVFEVKDANGNPLQFVVSAIEDGEVTCDFNHPLAGKTLTFEVEVKNIEPASEQEIAQLLGFYTSCSPTDCGSCGSNCSS